MGDALDTVMAAFEAIGQQLDTPDLEPDPARDDWDGVSERIDALRARLEEDVLGHLDEAAEIVAAESPVAPVNLRNNVAHVTAEVAAVHQAAGRSAQASTLFARALRASPSDETLAEVEAAAREPDAFVKLAHARWHHRASDFVTGDSLLRANKNTAKDPALRRAFAKALDGPRPMGGSAPALFRLNGFGVGLYGSRDHGEDGSHVATHALSALFLPILALGAYRVIDHGDGAFTFLAKERLSAFAKGWNFTVLGAVVLAIGWGAIGSWLDSPSRRASIALEDAAALETSGDLEGAAEAYQDVIDFYGATTGTSPTAATGLIRVLAARVEAPLTAARADEAVRVARRYQGLPRHAQGGAAASLVATELGEWADQIGDTDEGSRRASLRLVELGAQLAQGTDQTALIARAAALHVAIAESVRQDWPLEALHHYVRADTPEAIGRATPIVASLAASLLPDVAADVAAWEASADDAEAASHVAALRRTLAEWESDERRTLALASSDVEALGILHEERPEDQEVAASLADVRRGAGEVDGAIGLLEGYGAPGRLSSHAQRSLASCYADTGRLDDADALLTRIVEARLPTFQEAQQAYDTAAMGRVEGLIARAEAGNAPSLNNRLANVQDDARGREIVDAWLREQIEADASLTELREDYGAQSEVVPTVLALGTVKLRRAHEATGEERDALLSEAERLFLAIRQEAEGVPAYHMSLGQVYHRLGRSEEGEAELRDVLAGGEPELALQVASVYRELGLIERAREVATGVYEGGSATGADAEQLRLGAAQMMALMATTLDDREMWLLRAPQDSPSVRTELLDVRASRALEERDLAEASRLFAQVAQRYESEGENAPSALNNASIADMHRYRCDGDPAHLVRAGGRMQRAMTLTPDNALMIGNFAELEAYRADVQVLEGHLRTRPLRLASMDARTLVGWMLEGPRREEVLAALRADPQARRSRELTQQEQVLAPQRPRGWEREWSWAVVTRDTEALRSLSARLSAVTNLDHSRAADGRRERSAEQEASLRRQLDAAVADNDAIVAAARRTRHAPTTAAALHLLSSVLIARAWKTDSVEDARRATEVAREARATWDGFGDGQLPWALAIQAALELAPEQPALRATIDDRRDELSVVFLLEAAARRSPDVITALQRSALLDEACRLRAAQPVDQLGLGDILLGDLAADDTLQRAAAPVRTQERTRVGLDLRGAFDPDDAELASRRAILEG